MGALLLQLGRAYVVDEALGTHGTYQVAGLFVAPTSYNGGGWVVNVQFSDLHDPGAAELMRKPLDFLPL